MTDGTLIGVVGMGGIRNLGYIVTEPTNAKPCDAPHPHDPDRVPSVITQIGGCGCGEPDRVDKMMLAYLASREADGWPKPAPAGVSEDAALLLSYLADMAQWTEHGGSVGGAWLTDEGLEALANLRIHAAV